MAWIDVAVGRYITITTEYVAGALFGDMAPNGSWSIPSKGS